MSSGFRFDSGRCTGCSACGIACAIENPDSRTAGVAGGWRRVHTFNPRRDPRAAALHNPVSCYHCDDPACMSGCPAAAFRRDRVSGAVLVDRERCIGCRYCTWVCPYDAPVYDPRAGVVGKCTLCVHRLELEIEPACVVACPTGALGLEAGPRDDRRPPAAVQLPGLPEVGLGPALTVTGRRRGVQPPGISPVPDPSPTQRLVSWPPSWQLLGREWSLLAFTSIMTLMVAWFAAGVAGAVSVAPLPFVLAGLAAIAASARHLGRPLRMWRAILNLRHSWVSREVVLWGVFFACASALAFSDRVATTGGWLALGLGLGALVAADLVYRVPGQVVRALPHSAMTTLTVLYLVALSVREPWLAAVAGAVKLSLFLTRWRRTPWPLTAFRVVAGFVLPAAAWFSCPDPVVPAVTAAVGELADRALFYAELRFLSPGVQGVRDLERVVSGGQVARFSRRSEAVEGAVGGRSRVR